MATGYVVTGRGDLDALFKARSSSAGANTGFLSNGGVDLAQRFEPRGASVAIAATSFKVGATDLAQIFKDIAASSDIITNSTLTAGFASPRTGFAAGTSGTGLSAFGSLAPQGVGLYFIDATYRDGTGPNCYVTLRRNAVSPTDTDQIFKSVSYTGIFTDSAGGSVTRTVARSGASATNTNSSGGNFFRSWTFPNTAFQFISGNTYAVAFSQAP